MKQILLTRDSFRELVFKRDNHTCVLCGKPAVDAHHVLERRLFSGVQAGGYFLDNGASVCSDCHMACETTEVSVEDVRAAAGIKNPVIPDHMYVGESYDKWGNGILPNGMRTKGELFFEEGVQKVLAKGDKLHLFTDRVKYPRTKHMPFSPGATSDDKFVPNMSSMIDRRVILTEKMDGENTTMYPDYFHARSLDGRHHVSRDWVKRLWSTISYEIPEGHRICGENMFAEHSVRYENLKSYFYMFSMWTPSSACLSWDQTVEWAELLGIETVPVLYDGKFDEGKIRKLCEELDTSKIEGAVLRVADCFSIADFPKSVMKYVRKGHVQTEDHWMTSVIRPNGLA